MSDSPIDARLAELGLTWPETPAAVGSYLPRVRDGRRLVISGQLPFAAGELMHTGRVPSSVTLEQARAAARQCGLNALAQVRAEIDGDWSKLERIVRVGVFVASDADFDQQAAVANAVSDFLADLLGDRGRHARAAVGCSALPLHAPVEVEMTVRLAD